ncbi:hypothetical protein Pcac1_g25513 [Phytophthora cactorum]|uniref:Sfi1 spindle body domain-containing protein n=1 Tax=Phytophthora cactorum TaxID=29920 RepID=A0A329RU46_9STRA|nr:hypothetical protein Pcac1_g25513 [Phytophthora cactorum]KAG2812522.1 hypothetical protein PC112_g15134 [Phytophthora cactorum]KAG2923976.1 hypothetical protein PC117_g15536 [Phytophthora cactorum]KAG3072649.1 hypothetical protein PC122_g15162 [Phytophthora cactorum]RAW28025.1 hypothetical protein PC110_g15592 [Phytophthora cactorum]
MRSEYASQDTYSPPTRPSTWQLRFGKRSASQQNEAKPEVGVGPTPGNQARSPSISEQLLRALDTKPNEQEELSRECVDELIGRRNVFASEPELRLRTLTKDAEDGDTVVQEEYGHEGIAAEAKEIIRARFQIENQVKALRQAPKHRKSSTRRTETKNPHRGGPATRSTVSTNNTNIRMNHTTPSRHEKKDLQAHLKPRERNNQKTEVRPTKNVSRLQREHHQHKLDAATSRNKPRSYPQQLPMERRQQIRHQAREARKIDAAEERAMQKLLEPAIGDSNKEEILEQRRIEEEIERLTLENQQAAALEERLQHRKARLKSLSKVFDAWHKYVESKREHETRVAAEFSWRVMKRIMAIWKRYIHRRGQARAVEQVRLKLVREQQMNEQARQFYRVKRLPSWFYRWMAFVRQQKDRRAVTEAAERRRAQSQRLLERLQRQKTLEKSRSNHDDQAEIDIEESDVHLETTIESVPRTRGHTTNSNTETSVRNHQHRRKTHAWTDTERSQSVRSDGSSHATSIESPIHVSPSPHFPEASLTRAPQRVDKVYKAMEQRAVERKQRREELKRKYEELELKKRKEQDEQRAAREVLILEQQMEEKARIRERKLAEALALKEKQERRDHLLAQWEKAKKHNRRRLLFFYALLPWRKHHVLNERVARNAARWHELRIVYSHWERWQEFVQTCRKVHRRRDRARLEEAALHYALSLQRRVLWGLMRYHKKFQAQVLSVHRQHQWNTLQRSWTHWSKCLANERAHQQKIVSAATIKMQRTKLRRICARWRKVTNEAKLRQELELEKQQLWRKVRGWLDENE